MGFKTIDETWRTRSLADWLEAILVAPYISRAIATQVDVRSTDPYAHQGYDIYLEMPRSFLRAHPREAPDHQSSRLEAQD